MSGRPANVAPLYMARSLWERTEESELLTAISQAAVSVVEQIIREDPEFAAELVSALNRFADLCTAAMQPASEEEVYTEEDHAHFTALLRGIAARGGDDHLSELATETIRAAEPYQGVPARDIQERLGPVPDFSDVPGTEVDVELPVPSTFAENLGDVPTAWLQHDVHFELATTQWDRTPVHVLLGELREAQRAIAEKARSLGALASQPKGGIKFVEGGFVRRFADCDIYYSADAGAHEVHGEIRRKYDAVGGTARLGLPVTDEKGCPDGVGRYNHFAKSASIYWTSGTGPFYVRGVVRFRWASSGWEAGPLGYPVGDEDAMRGLYPQDNPDMHWSSFQHGLIFGQGREADQAVTATASREQIRGALFSAMNRRLPTTTFDVGGILVSARPGLLGVDVLGVDDWSYGFYRAVPRTLRVRIRGFVSIPLAPDPTFEVDLSLRFSAVWRTDSFMYPSTKTIVATLLSSRVRVHGVFSQTVADAIGDAVRDTFQPGRGHPEAPAGSMVLATVPTRANQRGAGHLEFLDVMLMADGSLNVFVNPLPANFGPARRLMAQNNLDDALGRL